MNFPSAIEIDRLRSVSLPKPDFSALRRFRPTRKGTALALVALVMLMAASWLGLRNSSLVAVKDVRVVGLSGYYDRDARNAVINQARDMTTMNVNDKRLAAAAGAFVDVAGVHTDAKLPHRLTIYVNVRRAVATAKIGTDLVALSGSGLILDQASDLTGLPQISVTGAFGKGKISDPKALEALKVLGAAPDVMLRKVKSLKWERIGLVVVLNKGVSLYFGDSEDAGGKWRSAVTVLAGTAAQGASYIDLRVASRPAIGGLGAAPVTPKPAALQDPLPVTAANTTGATGAVGATTTSPTTTQTQSQSTQVQAPANTQQQAPASGTNTQVPAGGAASPGKTG